MEDLRKLNPRTALVILGGALARRKAKDAKLRRTLAIEGNEFAVNEGAIKLAKEALPQHEDDERGSPLR